MPVGEDPLVGNDVFSNENDQGADLALPDLLPSFLNPNLTFDLLIYLTYLFFLTCVLHLVTAD